MNRIAVIDKGNMFRRKMEGLVIPVSMDTDNGGSFTERSLITPTMLANYKRDVDWYWHPEGDSLVSIVLERYTR